SHAVLPRPCLGDDPPFPHPLGKEDLADGVVDLVSAGVVEILSLEEDLRAPDLLREALREIERRRAPHVVLELLVKLGDKLWIFPCLFVSRGQFLNGGNEGLRDEAPPVLAKVAGSNAHKRIASLSR